MRLPVSALASLPAAAAVYADGGICLDILQNQWSPIYDVSAILTSIQVWQDPCSGGARLQLVSWRTRSFAVATDTYRHVQYISLMPSC
jgi:hypothetical protein